MISGSWELMVLDRRGKCLFPDIQQRFKCGDNYTGSLQVMRFPEHFIPKLDWWCFQVPVLLRRGCISAQAVLDPHTAPCKAAPLGCDRL